jgi:hypothetical protein
MIQRFGMEKREKKVQERLKVQTEEEFDRETTTTTPKSGSRHTHTYTQLPSPAQVVTVVYGSEFYSRCGDDRLWNGQKYPFSSLR